MTLDNMRERCAASARLRDGPDVLLCHCYMRERSTASARAWLLCLYYGHELLSHVGFCASARAWLRRPRAQAREHLELLGLVADSGAHERYSNKHPSSSVVMMLEST